MIGNKTVDVSAHMSSGYGYVDIVKYLLEEGANIDSQNEIGDTALHRAARRVHDDVMLHLISMGADHIIINFNGQDFLSLITSPELRERMADHVLCIVKPAKR